MILWQIQRKYNDVADTYAADARLLEFDIHCQTNKSDSYTEIPA
jgi:hypothetical protein